MLRMSINSCHSFILSFLKKERFHSLHSLILFILEKRKISFSSFLDSFIRDAA